MERNNEIEKAKKLIMRQAQTLANVRHTIGGMEKEVRPITLPKLKFMEDKECLEYE
jgi:hypothetical protein